MLRSIIVLALLIEAGAVSALDRWTTRDTIGEALYTAAHCADWSTTAQIAKWNGRCFDGHCFAESNPILGDHPSLARVNAYFALTLVAHAAVSALLPKPYRSIWQAVSFTVEAGFAGYNATSIGGTATVDFTLPW